VASVKIDGTSERSGGPASAEDRFAALLEEHRRILHKVARAYGRGEEDRRDLVQEMAAQLWRAFPRFDDRLRFSTWMYRVCLNVAISYVRRESVRARHLHPGDPALLEEHAERVGFSGDRDLRLLEAFLAGLDELDRALMLLYLDGCPHRAIGDVLGISETNVGTRIGRLKERLRRELSDRQL
jgi:RNA polymerase sigma factor (sigma-70 family)